MKLDMVGIVVDDMKKALKFYQALGFEVLNEFGLDYIELKNEGVRISLNTKTMVAGIYGFTPETIGNRIELAFLCNSPNVVDETIANMKSLGYEIFKTPWDAAWGQRYAIIKDVDGNLISLFANNPEVSQPSFE